MPLGKQNSQQTLVLLLLICKLLAVGVKGFAITEVRGPRRHPFKFTNLADAFIQSEFQARTGIYFNQYGCSLEAKLMDFFLSAFR